jgi:hypothetical protein
MSSKGNLRFFFKKKVLLWWTKEFLRARDFLFFLKKKTRQAKQRFFLYLKNQFKYKKALLSKNAKNEQRDLYPSRRQQNTKTKNI